MFSPAYRLAIIFSLMLCLPLSAFSQKKTISINNRTPHVLYIHVGGYAPSYKLKPGASVTLDYPFAVTPPNEKTTFYQSLLVATRGGKWMTTPNGFTYLSNPIFCAERDFHAMIFTTKNSWNINQQTEPTQDCKIKGYKQPWWQPRN